MTTYNRFCALLLGVFVLFSIVGCKSFDETKPVEGMHLVRDSTGVMVAIPDRPSRIIPVGVSSEDLVISLAGPERVVAIGNLPNNVPEESKQIQYRIKMNTESIMALQPDLLIVPDWTDPDMVVMLRALKMPVYVYKAPHTVSEIKVTIQELASILHEEAKGAALVADMEQRLTKVQSFTEGVSDKKVVAFYGVLGLTGGSGSTFDTICQIINASNAAAMLGLDVSESGKREDLLRINPDVIIVPSNVYSFDQYKEIEVENIYRDPALQTIKAVQNKRVYVIDARWIMSYSQFMVNAVEMMVVDVYGYKK